MKHDISPALINKPFSFSITKVELHALEDKMFRGNNGGKQTAKLSSKESRFLIGLISLLRDDYPDWFESIITDTVRGKANTYET